MSIFSEVRDAMTGGRAQTAPPVPYTRDFTGGSGVFSGSPDTRFESLDISTAESTMLSVLDLISSKTAEVEWELERVYKIPRPDRERTVIGPDQHLAAQLWNQPNDFMDGQQLRQLVTWHYDAVGEGYILADRFRGTDLIQALWPVRPDRMTPVVSEKQFRIGWMYTGPNGERIPLDEDEVLRIYRPHPWDVHRGLGLVQALLTAGGTSLTAQAWIRSFFRNDARPGGVIEIGLEPDEELTDDEFKILKRRWNENHDGPSRANRVGFLERGSWKDVQQSIKDMEYSGIRTLTRDQILETFRIHKHSMGIAEDVNRANATAANSLLTENTVRPRVGLWKKLANGAYLRLFGDAGRGVSFCPVNLDPLDPDLVIADRDSKTSSYKTLIDAGVDPQDAAVTVGLPPMKHIQGQAVSDARPVVTAA
jgi:HK97 family phage portal protein